MADEIVRPSTTDANGSETSQPGTAGANSDKDAPAVKTYGSSLVPVCGEPSRLPVEFAEAVMGLEQALGMPVWLFVQNGPGNELCQHIEEMFFGARSELPQKKPIAMLIESPGGSIEAAYGVAKLLQRRCGSFVAVVANWAKSAATLLALGASEIILAEHGQLGPLDAQLYDPAREEENSALNETQSLERLHAAGLEALMHTLWALKAGLRTRPRGPTKKFETLLPYAVKLVAESMRPLYEKVDVVQYTARLRDLKVAEEYAVRLLKPHYEEQEAKDLASALVENYPDHGFRIDFDEAKGLGIKVKEPTPEQSVLLDRILLHVSDVNAFGRVVVK
jgi:hypothetical protein